MGALLAYSLYSGIFLLAAYLLYKWAMAGEKQAVLNRAVLLGAYALSLCAWPLSLIRWPEGSAGAGAFDFGLEAVAAGDSDPSTSPLWHILPVAVFTVGFVAIVVWTAVVAVRLVVLVRSGRHIDSGEFTLVLHRQGKVAPFSWGRYVVMGEADYEAAGSIIAAHELAHIRCRHCLDLILAQAVCVLMWYNPAAWLMREELKSVHEYQADASVLASGIDARTYQMLLIKKAVGTRFQSLANSLNHSKLKKRITMMYNSRTSTTRRLRALVLVPALGGALLVTNLPAVAEVFDSVADTDLLIGEDKISENRGDAQVLPVDIAQYVPSADKVESDAAVNSDPEPARKPQKEVVVQKNTSDSDTEKAKATDGNLGEIVVVGHVDNLPQKSKTESNEVSGKVSDDDRRVYDVVETPPSFPGGQTELMKLIAQSVRYPVDAYRDRVQGRVVMQFVVDKDGKVTLPTVVRGVCESLDEEAKRVVMQLPDFIPGKLRGEPVAVRYTLPILFKLTNKKGSVSRHTGSKPVNVNEAIAIASGVTVLVNGKKVDGIDNIDPKSIQSIDVVKTDPQYPKGLIKITLKDGSAVATTTDAE